jgi:MarR family transcriptional regulator, 2-MHQ and catechol-resistance regulon repressor
MGRDQDQALKLFVVLNRAAAAVNAHAEADVAHHGLSLAEFASLEALFHKGPLMVGELQRAVLKSSGGMTYVVDRLEGKGLVRRRPCAEDRRALYAELTEKGEALMNGIFPGHAKAIERAVAGLTPDEQQTAADLLKRLGLSASAALPAARAAAASAPARTATASAGRTQDQ